MWKVSFLGKRAGNVAWGEKKPNKAASLPFWLRGGCDVKVELSLPKDYGNVFSFLFLRGGGLVYIGFSVKSLKQCCFPFPGAIVPHGSLPFLPIVGRALLMMMDGLRFSLCFTCSALLFFFVISAQILITGWPNPDVLVLMEGIKCQSSF